MHRRDGKGKASKSATKISYYLEVAFFIIKHSLGCCKPSAVFRSSGKVGSDSFCLLFDVSAGGQISYKPSRSFWCKLLFENLWSRHAMWPIICDSFSWGHSWRLCDNLWHLYVRILWEIQNRYPVMSWPLLLSPFPTAPKQSSHGHSPLDGSTALIPGDFYLDESKSELARPAVAGHRSWLNLILQKQGDWSQ